jgi:hypothetical protein
MSYKPVLEAIERIETLAELRGILKFLAQTKTTTSYVPLAAALGKFSGGSLLATMLGSIQTEDHSEKKPMTSSLVIGAQTGIPGNGYFSNARALGFKILKTPAEEFLFWADQMKQLGVQLPQSSIEQAAKLGLGARMLPLLARDLATGVLNPESIEIIQALSKAAGALSQLPPTGRTEGVILGRGAAVADLFPDADDLL